jgi:hypothetical protein
MVDKMKNIQYIVSLFVICSLVLPLSVVAIDTYPSLQISFSEEIFSATPGNQGYITLVLRNAGSTTVEGIQITASTADYTIIKSEGDWERSLGDISSGSSISSLFHYTVSSTAESGLFEMKFQIRTTNAGYHTQYALVKIEEPGMIDIVSLTPTYLDIGKQTTMTLTLSNNGQIDVANLMLSWKDDYTYILPVGTDNRIKISSVCAKNTTDVLFDVIVSPSLPAGVYPLYFTLDFYDPTGNRQNITSQIGVQIGGATDFEVVVEESASSTTTLAIANIGANTASSVIVSIPSQMSYAATGSNAVNLGNLEAGDYTLATFQLSQTTSVSNDTQFPFGAQGFNSSQRPSLDNPDFNMSNRPDFMNRSLTGNSNTSLTLRVQISYTDLFGIRQSVQKEVPMSSTSSSTIGLSSPFSRTSGTFQGQSSQSSLDIDTGTMYIIAGVLGIILIIVIVKFNTIKALPKTLKARKGRKNENK